MAQTSNLTAGVATDETALLFLALTSGSDRNRKLTLQTLFEAIRQRSETLQNKTLNGDSCEVPTEALTERYLFAKNILDNPWGIVAQRFNTGTDSGSITVTDGGQTHDRWYALVQTGNVTASTRTNDGQHRFPRLTNAAGSSQRMGCAQIIEQVVSHGLRGRPVTLSGKVRCSSAMTIRYAVLAWTSTADAPAKELVNDWASASMTLGGFFVSSNVALVGAGSTAVSAATVTDLTKLTATVPTSANNLFVMVWTDSQIANGGTLDFALQLEEGSAATPLELRAMAAEILRCHRYQRLIGLDDAYTPIASGMCTANNAARVFLPLSPPMRVAPTIDSASLAIIKSDGTHHAASGVTIDRATTRGLLLNVAMAGTPLTAGHATHLIANNTTAGYLFLDASL